MSQQILNDGETGLVIRNKINDNFTEVYTLITSGLIFKGSISLPADFPTSAEVQTGWFYKIDADVTDNDASKTNTGQSFKAGDEIAWNGTDWTEMGSIDLWERTGTNLTPKNTGDSVTVGNLNLDANTLSSISGNIVLNSFNNTTVIGGALGINVPGALGQKVELYIGSGSVSDGMRITGDITGTTFLQLLRSGASSYWLAHDANDGLFHIKNGGGAYGTGRDLMTFSSNGSNIGRVNFPVAASSGVGTQAWKALVDNTQANVLVVAEIDLGSSVLGHTGLKITAPANSTAQKAIDIDMQSGSGVALNIYGNDEFIGAKIWGASSNIAHKGFQYVSTTSGNKGYSFHSDVVTAGSNYHMPFYANVYAGNLSTPRTTDAFTLQIGATHSTAVKTENYNVAFIGRSQIGANLTAQGTVLKLQNSSSAVLLEQIKVLQLVQTSISTGLPLSIKQDATVSTNFRKIIGEENTGIIFWISDGTSPNGVLSGTSGDICYNGISGQPFYCIGTTNWISLDNKIISRTASAISYNPSVLTTDYIIAITDTSSPRTVTISTEDIQSGSTSNPRVFVVKDESGVAGTNAITIQGESGNIEGVASIQINTNGGSYTLYADGTNLYII